MFICTFIAPQPMLLMKSTGLVMLGAVGNLDVVVVLRFFRIDQPQEEVQLQRVDLVLHQQDLECHLGCEDQLVTLEQTPNIQQFDKIPTRSVGTLLCTGTLGKWWSLWDFSLCGPHSCPWQHAKKISFVCWVVCVYLYGNIKDNTECLDGELVHGIDPVEVVEDEVEDGCSGGRRSVQLPGLKKFMLWIGSEWNSDLVNLCRRLLCLGDFVFDLCSSFLGVLQVLHQRRIATDETLSYALSHQQHYLW